MRISLAGTLLANYPFEEIKSMTGSDLPASKLTIEVADSEYSGVMGGIYSDVAETAARKEMF